VKRTIGEAKQDRIMLTAAGVAFYWFLSVLSLRSPRLESSPSSTWVSPS
jgi:hypothetical protein